MRTFRVDVRKRPLKRRIANTQLSKRTVGLLEFDRPHTDFATGGRFTTTRNPLAKLLVWLQALTCDDTRIQLEATCRFPVAAAAKCRVREAEECCIVLMRSQSSMCTISLPTSERNVN